MDNLTTPDVSVSTSAPVQRGWRQLLWGGSLLILIGLLAIHVALAHSPDLARYVPEGLIRSPASCPSHSVGAGHSGGCELDSAPAFSGCRVLGTMARPVLTDTLFQDDVEYQPAEMPADAEECSPEQESDSGDEPTDLRA